MAQNIYDDKSFFEGYSQLPRQVRGLSGAPEWEYFQSLIPDLRDLTVLDLGCGYGWLCRWARENGARKVQGVDVSKNMLSKAREYPVDSGISYLHADLETIELSPLTYEVVYSSLALHYLKNLPQLIRQVYQSLRPGGCFIFSVEHPIYTSPRDPRFIENADGKQVWPLDNYLNEGERRTNWFAEGVVKQHRTIGTYLTILLDAGFQVAAINEWGPSLEQVREKPSWADNRERPMFLIVKVTKLLVQQP